MLSGISIWQLLILLAIVVMVFGTKRLRNLGGDLGGALRDFRSSMKQGEDDESDKSTSEQAQTDNSEARVIDQESGESGESNRRAEEPASRDHTS